jgi:hypothetical protein
MASAFGERTVSWGKVGRIRKRRRWKEKDGAKKLPPPPSSHPSAPFSYRVLHFPGQCTGPTPTLESQCRAWKGHDRCSCSPIRHGGRNCCCRDERPFCQCDQSHRSRQSDQRIRLPSTPVNENTFAPLPSEASPPPLTTWHPVTTELSALPIQDHLPRTLFRSP